MYELRCNHASVPSSSQASCSEGVTVFGASASPGAVSLHQCEQAADFQDATATILTPGQTVEGVVSPTKYVYFELPAPSPAQDVYFDVTPISIGDPDVFVACKADQDLTGNDAGTPSSANGHHTWGSVSIGVDTVHIPANAAGYCGGAFIAGVTGYNNYDANFTLVATTTEHKYVDLLDGQIQSGSVALHHYSYFQFTVPGVPGSSPIIELSLTTSLGDADIYMRFGNNDPSTSDWDYRGTGSGSSESIRIMPDGSSCPVTGDPARCYCPAAGPCVVHIAVYGYTRAEFSLQVTTDAVEQQLQDNSPVVGHVEGGEYSFFRYGVPLMPNLGTQHRLVISVSKLTGDPDLYVSRKYSNPTATTYAMHPTEVWNSLSLGDGEVVLTGDDLAAGQWHIGVLGFGNTTFSISASLQSTSDTTINALLQGTPQTGDVADGDWQYYGFTASPDADDKQSVRFTLSPLESESEMLLYVRTCPSNLASGDCVNYLPTEHVFNFTSQHTATAEVVQVHPDFACDSCVYVVGVRAVSGGLFSISAATGLLPTVLRTSVPTQDIISEHAYHYFAYVVQEPGVDVVISTSPQVGDVDLMVSACGYINGVYNAATCNHAPNMTSFTWGSFGFGNDAVVIETGDTKRCQPRLGVPCVYTIGVYGYTSASYSIVGRLHEDDPAVLRDGVPVSGAVPFKSVDNYIFTLGGSRSSLDVTLTTTAGDADLYVLVNTTRGRAGPGAGHYDFAGLNAFGDDALTVPASDPRFKAACPNFPAIPCPIGVGVYGSADFDSTYSLVASSQGGIGPAIQQLTEGVSVTATVQPGKYLYFTFPVVKREAVTVSVTPTGSGDPDIVLNAGSTLPTVGNSDFEASSDGFDVITVQPFPQQAKACPKDDTSTCTYTIGVTPHQDTDAATFNILVRTADGTATVLQPGQRVRGQVERGETQLFAMQLVNDKYEHIEVSLTSLIGDADLYVTLDGTNPTLTHFQYVSISPTSRDYIYIHKSDAAYRTYCAGGVACPVRVLVAGFQNTTFDLVASTEDSPVELTAGQATYDHVSAGLYDYFRFTSHVANANLRFALTSFSGDPDMLVGRGDLGQTRPVLTNASSYIRSSTWDDLDIIEIDHNDPDACPGPCTYYIGVTGAGSNASFAITVTEGNETFVLVDGQTVFGYVSPHTTAQAVWVVRRSTNEMLVTLNPVTGDPDLYINIGQDSPAPNARDHDYASISTTGNDEVRMSWSDDQFDKCAGQENCVVRVGVQGFTTSYFYLTASSSRYTSLVENIPQRGNVGSDGYAYFSFDVANDDAAVVIALTALAGDPDMYVNSNGTVPPSPGNRDFAETSLSGGIIEIYPTDQGACSPPCTYYIGVTAFATSASFSIMARTHGTSPTLLSDGRPQIDTVDKSARNYYIAYIPALNPSLEYEVSVTPRFGDSDLYARLGNDTLDRTSYQYLSLFSGTDTITIRGNDTFYKQSCMHLGQDTCLLQIMVYGYTQSEYSIVAAKHGSLTHLEEGIPVRDNVLPGSPEFFVFSVDNPDDISFALNPLSGDADMYVTNTASNNTRPGPNAGQYTWRSNGLGYESIFIDKDYPAAKKCPLPCKYYIGVYAFGGSPSTFTISASTGTPVLSPGVPVSGIADRGKFAYYSFTPGPDVANFSITVAATRGSAAGYIGNDIDVRNGGVIKPSIRCSDPACRAYTVVNADWSTAASSGGTVTISQENGKWPGADTFVVAILSPPTNGPDGSSFTITVSTSDSITALAANVPSFGSVAEGNYRYYSYTLTSRSDSVSMQVTAFSGDSDMYVSINADVSMPNPQNGFDFFSISFFNDTVHLSPTTLQPCFEQADALGLQGCTIYTSVYGFRAAQYSIVAQVGAEGEVLLVDGTPQQGNVAEGEYAYFKALVDFPADALQGYSVTVTPRSGDPDLYVITTRDELPSSQNFDRRSIGFGRETVSFSPGTEFYEAKTTVHIAVYGWQTGADFDIVFATASKDETLQDGKQSQVTLDAGSSAFFRFPMYTDAADLQYAISSLSGDVNFYITLPDNVTSSTVPGPSNYIWQGNAAGAGVANTIKRSDPAFRSGVDYLFGLYNPSTTVKVTATIVAHVSTTIVSLTAGSPQLGGVSAGEYTYYTYSCGVSCTWKDLTISATPTGSGNARVVVTDLYRPGNAGAPLPTLENNVWSSDDGTSQDQYTIVIPAGDPKHTAGQTTFTIGVYGWLSTVAFNVLVSTSEVPTILRVGTPSARVSVAAGDTKHFMAYIDDTSVDLIATVTPLSGDPDILISSRNTNPYCVQAGSRARALAPWAGKTPLLQDFMPSDVATVSDTLGAKLRTCYGARWYTSNEGDGAPDVLTISAASPCDGPNVNRTGCVPALDWRPGLFYIGIFATTTTQFSVTLYSDGLTSLNGGQAAQGQARKLSPVYFVFTDQNSGSDSTHDLKVTISRNTASGAHTWPLLVFMNSCLRSQCTADDRHPSAGHHEPGGVFQVGSDRTDFFITPQDALACVPVDGDECQYYFAVSAECAGGVHAAVCKQSFYITVTVQDGDSVETVPFSQINGRVNVMQGSAPIGTIPKFEMFLGGEEPTDVIMHLDSCGVDYSGVYVCDPSKTGQDACQDAFNPSSTDHTAGNMSSSATRGSAVVNIQGTTAQSLYVGVQNSGQPQQVTLQLPRGDVVHTHLGRRSLEGAGLVLGATAPVYEFELDVFTSTAYVLEQPDSPGVSVDHEQGTSASVSWQPAKLVQPSTGAELVLQQAEYTVFAGQGGFSGAALQEGIPTTPCGMERWFAQLDSCAEGSTEGHCGSVTARAEQGQTSVVVGGLVPNTAYEFAVMVTCDVACWAAAFPGNSSTNHAEQRMLYPSTASANSGAASSRKAPKQPLAPGITAVIVLSVLLAVVAVVAFVWWRRRTVARAQNQYTVMGGDDGYSGHSGTSSAPADTSATSYGRLVDDEGAGDVEFRDRLAQYMDQ